MSSNIDELSKSKLFSEFAPVSTEKWEEIINKDLKGADYDKRLIWKTTEGFNVRPYYRAEDLENIEYLKTNPNEFPFTRGNKKDNNNWDIRQDIETENILEANKIALDAISKGANSIGFKAKNIANSNDMTAILSEIDLTKISINFNFTKSYTLIFDLFSKEVERQNIDLSEVRGSLNFDPISFLLLNGNFYNSKENNFEEALYLLKNSKLPNFKLITINGQFIHNSGASIVQELGFSLASANEYVSQLLNKGLSIDEITPKIQFSFAVGSNYFLEIAKLRAARVLWANIVEQYSPKNKEYLKININTTTSFWNKSIYDPYVNMLRTTTEAMSAAIGGSDSITVQPFDITYKNPDEISRRIARNTQTILKSESYFDKIVDPSAGSYYIETLTNSIAEASWKLFQLVEEKDGIIEAVLKNFVQDEIEKTCQQRNMDIAMRKQVILGTNQYPNLNEMMIDKIDSAFQKDNTQTKPQIAKKISIYRASEEFEKIRLEVETSVKSGNKVPKVFLYTTGNLAMRKARATFSTNFFGCAGYNVKEFGGYSSFDESKNDLTNFNPNIVVICASDEDYALVGCDLIKEVKKLLPNSKVVIAGNPTEIISQLKEAGTDDFIHVRSNVLETLKKFNSLLIV